MSYSRWSHSRWYTYYRATESYERDEQYFDICTVKCFSFKELMKDLDKCLEKAIAIENKEAKIKVSGKERQELRCCMLEFLEDVRMDKKINEYMAIKEAPDKELPLFVNVTGPAADLLRERLKKTLTGGYPNGEGSGWKPDKAERLCRFESCSLRQ